MKDLNAIPHFDASMARCGHAFVPAQAMRRCLERHGELTHWPAFASSWDDLQLDAHMGDGGRYRLRRHATYCATAQGLIVRTRHRPHFQSRACNPLNGGVARWFAPVDFDIGQSPCLGAILRFCNDLFCRLSPSIAHWFVEVHQFRIQARPGETAYPTPEGIHRDGVDYVLMLLIDRRNIASGVTSILNTGGEEVGSYCLDHPLDAVLVDDSRVFHGVTPVHCADPEMAAYRDVLVITFRQSTGLPALDRWILNAAGERTVPERAAA